MNSISQLMKYRKSMVEYVLKHGVAKTAIKYNTYCPYIAGFDVMTPQWSPYVSIPQAKTPSQSTYSCGIKAHSGYEASKSRSRSGGFLGKARQRGYSPQLPDFTVH